MVKNLIKTSLSIIRIVKRSYIVGQFPNKLENDIYVLGNGPSVKTCLNKNKEFFKLKTTMCVNQLATSEFYSMIKPKYYMICDPVYWTSSEDLSDRLDNLKNSLLDAWVNKTDWNMYLFLPVQVKKNKLILEQIKRNPNITIVFFNTTTFEGFRSIKFKLWKWRIASPVLINVLISSLYVSINMGYKNIYLLGAESSWFKSLESGDDNKLYMVYPHCYDKREVSKAVIYSNTLEKIPVKIHEEMYSTYLCFREYHEISDYAKILKAEIVNITPNSFIDAFEKRNIF